jgi:hypothetical protein
LKEKYIGRKRLTVKKTKNTFWGISVHEIIEKYQSLKSESGFPRRYIIHFQL